MTRWKYWVCVSIGVALCGGAGYAAGRYHGHVHCVQAVKAVASELNTKFKTYMDVLRAHRKGVPDGQ